jgi:hypothetical protein
MLLDDALEVRKHDVVSIAVSDSKVAGESSLLQVNRLEPESAEPQRHKKFKPVRIMDNLDILARFFGVRSIWTKSSWRYVAQKVPPTPK